MNNWFDHILHHMRSQPETPALVMEDRVVTYGMLRVAVERCAQRIAALELTGDVTVAVLVENPIRHMALCLALFGLGIRGLSLNHSQSGIRDLNVAAVLGDDAARRMLAPLQRLVDVTDAWFTEDVPARPLPRGFADLHQVCRESLTSGTTGAPKLLRFTVEDIGRRTDLLLSTEWRRLLCLPGLSAAWGFWTSCATLVAGGTLCFSASPYQSLRMIELFAIDTVVASSEQLLALTRAARSTGVHLSSLRGIEIAGGLPTRVLLESAMIHVCRNIFCRLGASELGPIARAPAREVLDRPGFTGRLLPGVEIAIVDSAGRPCPAGTVGLLRGRSDTRWDAGAQEVPWIELGDLGWLTPEGELFVIGRAADLGTPNANTVRQVSPIHEAEHLLRLEWDSADAAAVAMGQDGGRPAIWIGIVDGRNVDAGKLEAMLRARGIDCTIQLVPVTAIPRGPNGKVQRAQLEALLRSAMPA